MKVFFDTNVWIASFIARGLCADLVGAAMVAHDTGGIEVLTCPAVLVEAERLLRDKFRANDAQWYAADTVFSRITMVVDGAATIPSFFPDPDDWPIIAAAVEAHADLFVTGDKALLELRAVENMPVVSPREAFLRLRNIE